MDIITGLYGELVFSLEGNVNLKSLFIIVLVISLKYGTLLILHSFNIGLKSFKPLGKLIIFFGVFVFFDVFVLLETISLNTLTPILNLLTPELKLDFIIIYESGI